MSVDKLSPERYEATARSFEEMSLDAQNEASYNFEGADPELDSVWASMYSRLAELLRERIPANGDRQPDQAEEQVLARHPGDIEELKVGVINTARGFVEGSPIESSEEHHSKFRSTRSDARTSTSISPGYSVSVSDIMEATSFLGIKTGENRKLRVIENDGTTEEKHRSQFEPYALVQTIFDIDPITTELTITQRLSGVVEPEHRVIFPNLGIDQKTSDEQWIHLSGILSGGL